MHIRGVLFVVACVAAQGCSKDKAADPPAKAEPKGSGSAKPEPAGLRLASAPEAVAQPVTATAAIVIAKDGSLSVAKLDPTSIAGVTVASVKGEPVADVARLPESLAALSPAKPPEEDPPPEEPEEEEAPGDDPGGAGTAMSLDEGKMGKKDSDRAEGQYKMKNNNQDPELAREEAMRKAREAGVLGVLAEQSADPCAAGGFASLTGTGDISSGFDDADIYGGLLGNEPGEMQGGFGYGRSGSGTGAGYGGEPIVIPAGLRARSLVGAPACARDFPLVLADVGAPAARLVEVLSAFPYAQLGITTDGGAHVQALATMFSFRAGSRPEGGDAPEVGITIGPDGPRGSGYRGATADAALWTWDGRAGGLADTLAATAGIDALRDAPLRIRIDRDVTAGALIDGVTTLVGAGVPTLAFGEPVVFESAAPTRTRTPVPAVRIGQPAGSGDLDKATVRRYIKRNLPKIRYCYEKQLLAKPGIEGRVDTKWLIKPDGTVSDASASGVDPEVASCIQAVISAIEFPKPKGGGPVNVTSYPFEFRPSGG